MAENSKIEWTHHTFNPWRGCTKVSAGCANCYAEKQALRNPRSLGVWGQDGDRAIAAESYWQLPYKWNTEAILAGEQRNVFCASMADVYEGDDSMPASSIPLVRAARRRLFRVIQATPGLNWLLLTKRPENIMPVVERAALDCDRPDDTCDMLNAWLKRSPPPNVWLGASVEDRKHGVPRIDLLRKVPAAIRFLSVEPLLGDLGPFDLAGIHWVIVGGESGPKARPMHPEWARSLRDQCQAAGVAFFFKQWGEFSPFVSLPADSKQKGHTWDNGSSFTSVARVGKKAAGRLLDGVEHNEFPTPNPLTRSFR